MMVTVCCRFGDNDVEMAVAVWDDGINTERVNASYVPLPPSVTVRPAAAATGM